jgi:hypothetical protein
MFVKDEVVKGKIMFLCILPHGGNNGYLNQAGRFDFSFLKAACMRQA